VLNHFLRKVAIKEQFTKAKEKQVIENRLYEYNKTYRHSLAG